jgi:uncharacterized membrane protein YhaH (DUF805 family)
MDTARNPTYTCLRVRLRELSWRHSNSKNIGSGVVSGSSARRCAGAGDRLHRPAVFNQHHGRRWMNWYLGVLKKYVDFSGRARRKEYWVFFLFNLIISCVLSAVDVFIGTYSASAGIGLLAGLYGLAVLLPGIGVTVRRLHDTGRSGWWILIALIPLVGWIVLLVFMLLDSQPETNAYGPNPKAGETAVPAAA